MNYKEEAEKIVDKYMPYADKTGVFSVTQQCKRYNATQCAILEVEAIIDELGYYDYHYATKRTGDYMEILNQLKQM